jgi:precorrin-6Y C5,15-methyltransferase (decarboxylating)
MSDSPTGLAKDPWIWIIGIGEDGLSGLSQSSRDALAQAEIVFGGARHLKLAEIDARGRIWSTPFSVDPVLDCRGRRVAVLASGDPFWHGAGGSLATHLAPGEWIAFPAPSTFSLAAARLGWRLEDVSCLGLHAAPFETLLPHLAPARRAICLVRDGAAAGDLAAWLTQRGFGASSLCVMERLGGPSERIRTAQAAGFDLAEVTAPIAVAIVAAGAAGLPRTAGLPDDAFLHDGQITKRPMRALTLSALAPRPGEILWDIGAGSGSISVEWCLAGGHAFAIEARADRARNIRANAAAFGVVNCLTVVEQQAPAALQKLPLPNAVFVGGGGDQSLFDALWAMIPRGARLVANAVTLETEALLLSEQNRRGGELMRIELSQATPLGSMRSWVSARPVVQWSVVR